jgi:HEAT repeat protein
VVAVAGHRGDEAVARTALADPAGDVRATALGALARMGRLRSSDVICALGDPDPLVRRRAGDVSPLVDAEVVPALLNGLDDSEPLVVEAVCAALGERGEDTGPGAVSGLSQVAGDHPDPLCREAAVAALGAIGDPDGLPAILAATTDKPAVRRRAVLALAPFGGPDVEAALQRARSDRDWQVRQAAEDLG